MTAGLLVCGQLELRAMKIARTITLLLLATAAISLGAAQIVAPIGEIAQYALGKAA